MTNDGPSLAKDGRHAIKLANDGPPWNVMTVGELSIRVVFVDRKVI